MTITEVLNNSVAETGTIMWTIATADLKARFIASRLMEWNELTDEQRELIGDFLAGGDGEPVTAKKIKQKRGPRKSKSEPKDDPKTVPLTQHATAEMRGNVRDGDR